MSISDCIHLQQHLIPAPPSTTSDSRAAWPLQGTLVCGWLDGKMHAGKMSALGLSEKLPAIAINTMQSGRFTFPANSEFTEAAITLFVEDFVAGRLKSGAQVDADLDAQRLPIEKVEGSLELTKESFVTQVMQDTSKDVVVLFYTSTQQLSVDFVIYWKKTVERFHALKIRSVKLARYDVAKYQVPMDVEFEHTPAVIMFTAKDKTPPFKVRA